MIQQRHRRAITRAVSARIDECCLEYQQRDPIDVPGAARQHATYVSALRNLGIQVTVLPSDDTLADCCFVEDTAVITERFALITNMARPERRGEQKVIRDFLRDAIVMQPPAQLDGGDVLRIEDNFYVGLSRRTNPEGIRFLRNLLTDHGHTLFEVPVEAALHLKTAVTYAGEGIVVCSGTMRSSMEKLLSGFDLVEPPPTEQRAANVLRVNDTTIIPAGCPQLSDALATRGLKIVELNISEFAKAEAGLTCLSILY